VFDRLRALAGHTQPGLFAVLDGGSLLERSEDRLRFDIPQPFSARRLRDKLPALEALCERFFGRPMGVEIECPGETRERANADEEVEVQRQRRQQALNHPAVHTALEVLEGEIVEIRPLGEGR
jgi:hypothetical protein